MNSTPTFYVNGYLVVGANMPEIVRLIDRELLLQTGAEPVTALGPTTLVREHTPRDAVQPQPRLVDRGQRPGVQPDLSTLLIGVGVTVALAIGNALVAYGIGV